MCLPNFALPSFFHLDYSLGLLVDLLPIRFSPSFISHLHCCQSDISKNAKMCISSVYVKLHSATHSLQDKVCGFPAVQSPAPLRVPDSLSSPMPLHCVCPLGLETFPTWKHGKLYSSFKTHVLLSPSSCPVPPLFFPPSLVSLWKTGLPPMCRHYQKVCFPI